MTALEQLFEAKMALGRHSEVVSPLEGLIAAHPYRERLHAQLMLALYRSDRQADALQAYQNARRRLVEELGIEPGAPLRELEQAVLAQDPALALPVPVAARPEASAAASQPAEPEAPPAPAARRLVSIVFVDLVGSTGLAERLDPESMHALLDRFMDRCSTVIERHENRAIVEVNQAVHSWGGITLHDIINDRFAHKAIEKGADGLIAVAALATITLFAACGPCLVLIDEWVAYAREL